MGIVGAVAHEKPHDNVALEQFLPHGPFAQLPMNGIAGHPHVSAIVWTERTAIARRCLALDNAAYGRQLQARLGDHLGRVAPIGRRWSYPLTAMHAARYTDERMALVGDAAHGIHPIAGQGLNLGFRDVAVLAEMVIEAVNAGEDPGGPALLARYQAARRPDSLVMLGATHVLERLFSSSLPPVRLARRLGIAAVDRMPRLKRFFASRAMGLGGGDGAARRPADDPRRGRGLTGRAKATRGSAKGGCGRRLDPGARSAPRPRAASGATVRGAKASRPDGGARRLRNDQKAAPRAAIRAGCSAAG